MEISLKEALIVCENGKLRIGELVQEMGGKEAAYLSSWEKRMVDIPNIGTDEELEFERLFEKWLEQKRSR